MNTQRINVILLLTIFVLISSHNAYPNNQVEKPWDNGRLVVSENHRFLQHENGKPFFWLGDTGWLLFSKLDRDEARTYLENRRQKGFNVIQVMVLHGIPQFNIYRDSALTNNNPAEPLTTPGNSPEIEEEYDYWDHVDYIVETAAQKGIYIAMVPTWGSNVRRRRSPFTVERAQAYGKWLAERYRNKTNIIWINGGDTRGDQNTEIWRALGTTLHEEDINHLMTFHPFGRTQSSMWFHNDEWLDFNMFQSGHRRYDQIEPGDDIATWKGEDNWKYVLEDYAKTPPKPTIDGEPSYENIPQGLHDPKEPFWKAKDARRYAYWSVFAGSFGHTYGNGAVMGMRKPDPRRVSYGVQSYWYEGINDPGAGQMLYLKNLILSRPFFERVYDSSIIIDNGEKYDFVIATRGKSYALIYTYTGRDFEVALGKITGKDIIAHWYNPRDGKSQLLGKFDNKGTETFDPPGEKAEGNDWVLILDDASKQYSLPGNN
ncbi:MAG: glycoside hydrolase family 140 protein [Sedimentisphaerales bacterium]|nr:glycoside hydrolase family 140 protein [Sedimentisphaerales bacterium]